METSLNPGNNPTVPARFKAPAKPRLLISGTRLITECLRKLLETDFDLVGTMEEGVLKQAIAFLRPDIILLETVTLSADRIEEAIRLRDLQPRARLVFISHHADAMHARIALDAGVSGIVTTALSAHQLRRAMHMVLSGNVAYVSAELRQPMQATASSEVQLTSRQQQVLHLVSIGKTRKEIAALLQLSPKTVEFHKARIMDALGVRTTADLVRYVLSRPSAGL